MNCAVIIALTERKLSVSFQDWISVIQNDKNRSVPRNVKSFSDAYLSACSTKRKVYYTANSSDVFSLPEWSGVLDICRDPFAFYEFY